MSTALTIYLVIFIMLAIVSGTLFTLGLADEKDKHKLRPLARLFIWSWAWPLLIIKGTIWVIRQMWDILKQ